MRARINTRTHTIARTYICVQKSGELGGLLNSAIQPTQQAASRAAPGEKKQKVYSKIYTSREDHFPH